MAVHRLSRRKRAGMRCSENGARPRKSGLDGGRLSPLLEPPVSAFPVVLEVGLHDWSHVGYRSGRCWDDRIGIWRADSARPKIHPSCSYAFLEPAVCVVCVFVVTLLGRINDKLAFAFAISFARVSQPRVCNIHDRQSAARLRHASSCSGRGHRVEAT